MVCQGKANGEIQVHSSGIGACRTRANVQIVGKELNRG